MVGLKNGHIRKNLTQKMVNPRDVAGEHKEEEKENWNLCSYSFVKWHEVARLLQWFIL